jgi:hypothetical protein
VIYHQSTLNLKAEINMKRLPILAAALAAVATSLSAHADVLDTKFFGTVQSQANAGFTIDSPISGEFLYDTESKKYISFSIGGQSVAEGFSSTASLTPDLFSALYRAQLSPLDSGGNVNSTFTLDLEALDAPWNAGSAVQLLTSVDQLATNLDTENSSFGFFTAKADGTGIESVMAQLAGITVTQVPAVPEPSTWALFVAGIAAFGIRRRLSLS